MNQRIVWWTLAVVLAAALPAPAQEKFDIKLKKAGVGETELIEKTEVENNASYLTDLAGKKLKDMEKLKKETRTVYRETVLEKPADAKRPTKLKRRYEKAVVINDGKATMLAYEGKTVVIEKKEDGYRFFIEGGDELKGKEAALLAKEFNKKSPGPDFEKLLMPGRAVAVGDTWKLDTAAILEELKSDKDAMQVDEAGVQGTGKLVKAYQKDGRQFGVLHIKLTLPIKAIPAAKGLEIGKGTKMVILADMDLCIDGTAPLGTVVGRVEMDLRGTLVGQQTGILATTRSVLTESHKEAGPR